jgi:Tfp pilus assembly protein PilF
MVMEDPAVRTSWRNTILAALCAMGAAATPAAAIPFVSKIWGNEDAATTTAPVAPRVAARTAPPSTEISPVRHPVKYLAAAISEMPLPGKKKEQAVMSAESAEPRDAIRLDEPSGPPSPQLLIALAQMSERQGDVGQARHHYQSALKQWPGQVDVLLSAARMEDRLGNMAVAEGLYQQAVVANPQHAGAHNDFGLCLARQGKLQPSIQELERAISLQADKPLYRNNAATVLVELRDDQRALAHLAAVHGPALAHYNMGQLLVQRKRASEAAGYYVRALELDPSMQAAHAALAQMQGTTMVDAPVATSVPATPGGPVVGPQQRVPAGVPQQASPGGPQLGFPATAQSPGWGTSSYVPPGYYAPNGQFVPQADPRVGQLPRYLPPTGIQQQQQPVGYRR